MIVIRATMKLNRDFYNRNTLTVSKELLGKYLICKVDSTKLNSVLSYSSKVKGEDQGNKKLILVGKIVETEAYKGPEDLASHASRGRTPRTEIMFGPPGYAYIYLIYGMYFCLNVVTEPEGYPAAVLIRAIELVKEGIKGGRRDIKGYKGKDLLTNGPGKLCRYFGIDKSVNGIDICGNVLWVEDRNEIVKKEDIVVAKRIGVDYAKHCKDRKWRFYIKNNPCVSKC